MEKMPSWPHMRGALRLIPFVEMRIWPGKIDMNHGMNTPKKSAPPSAIRTLKVQLGEFGLTDIARRSKRAAKETAEMIGRSLRIAVAHSDRLTAAGSCHFR